MHDDEIEPFYDLNNFNEYTSGLLTMFNIFVVNDWQAIAGVYLNCAEKLSSPYIVYPFFVIANLVGVNIMLNVFTAFFVGAFVTKVEDKSSLSMSAQNITSAMIINDADCFRVQERHGYDSVISTITGHDEETIARHYQIALKEQIETEKKKAIREARSIAASEIASIKTEFEKLQQQYCEVLEEKNILMERREKGE
jgi:hypothetical protein